MLLMLNILRSANNNIKPLNTIIKQSNLRHNSTGISALPLIYNYSVNNKEGHSTQSTKPAWNSSRKPLGFVRFNKPRHYQKQGNGQHINNQQQNRQDENDQKIKKQQEQRIRKQQVYNGEGYGYYDWNDQNSYIKAMEQKYFLDDLIAGCRKLKNKNIEYKQQHIKFILYTAVLFPLKTAQLVAQILPALTKLQESPNFYQQIPSYMAQIKFLCSQAHFKYQKDKLKNVKELTKILQRRIQHPQNNKDIQSLYNTVCFYYFVGMYKIAEMFNQFKQLLYKEMIDKKYKLSPQTTRMVTQIYHKVMIAEPKLKNQSFFNNFPNIFQKDQQTFQNMIQLLPQFLIFNQFNFENIEEDLRKFHNKISQCRQFKSQKTKQLLAKYAQHLVLLGNSDCINFTHLLDPI